MLSHFSKTVVFVGLNVFAFFWFSVYVRFVLSLSVCVFVCLSVCLFVCLSVCVFVCLCVCVDIVEIVRSRESKIEYKKYFSNLVLPEFANIFPTGCDKTDQVTKLLLFYLCCVRLSNCQLKSFFLIELLVELPKLSCFQSS